MKFDFGWDPRKAKVNQRKHGVSFGQAATVFKDPRMLSVFDHEHSEEEERWVTLGISSTGALLAVHHSFKMTDTETALIRIISSRKATRAEKKQYAE